MAGPERALLVPQRFEPESYSSLDIPPVLITRQTNTLLGIYYRGEMRNPGPAKNYFIHHTVPYLKAAEVGSRSLFGLGRTYFEAQDLEVGEPASHALVVFANLPDGLNSDLLPDGFSRRATLRPPETRYEYIQRIRELRVGIRQVAEGEVEPGMPLEGSSELLRTFGFFKVASELPIRSDPEEIESITEKGFNELLRGVQF